MISATEAARLIDISAVKTHHTLADIKEVVAYAKKYHFINVHVLPAWVSTLSEMLKDINGVYVGSPVGFPSGAHCTSVKLSEAQQLLQDGVEEMDIVMNVGKFKNREYTYVQEELRKIISIKNEGVLTKVIIEINTLTDDEMLKACEIAIRSGADFVKTGTGWIPGNANIERIRKMKEYCGTDIKIKAAGGIRTQEEFLALYDMGVERMGINTQSALQIVESLEN